jgi:DNA ligase (NAD+)
VLARLKEAGVRPAWEKRARGSQPLAGEVVLFTGGLEALSRPDAERKAEDAGAEIASSVGRKVTLVSRGRAPDPSSMRRANGRSGDR